MTSEGFRHRLFASPRIFTGIPVLFRQAILPISLSSSPESFTRAQDLRDIRDTPDFWILNLRVSKLGGLIRSLDFLTQARSLGLQLIIGAHVGETSVLSRAGLTLASAAGDAMVTMEGAFGIHLLEYDVCDPPLMFGKDGILRPDEWHLSTAKGNGLEIKGPLTL